MLQSILLVLVCSFLGTYGQFVNVLLKDVKDSITLPKYTLADRQLVFEQVEHLLSIYVNKESKLQHYGIDPAPEMARIQAQLSNMTNEEFHFSMSRMFKSFRDLHTNYYMPTPYSCYTVFYPLRFGLVNSSDILQEPMIAVKSLANFPEVVNFNPHVKQQVQLGDILVSMNGKTYKEWLRDYGHLAGGANDYGAMRMMLNYMSYRQGRTTELPMDEEVTYVLKRTIDSEETYTIKAAAVARYSKSCLASSPSPERTFSGSRAAPIEDNEDECDSDPFAQGLPQEIRKQLDMMENPDLDEMKQIYGEEMGAYKYIGTTEPTLSWSMFQHLNHTFGIIRLDSMRPTNESPDGVIRIIRSLLVGPMNQTDALVFDVRDNGGGFISLADTLPQLFVPDYEPNGARALVAPLNEQLFLGSLKKGERKWYDAYSAVQPGDQYTPIVQFTSTCHANMFGQAYFKPVAVFTNGNCYSACDLFSANMQDSGAAVYIFGEDGQTGAGGANVVEHKGFFVPLLNSVFKRLPGNQDMRLGWRQTVRNGKNQGKLVEDDGVYADVIVRPQPQDYYANATLSSQFYTIADYLIDHLEKQGRGFEFYAEPQIEGNIHLGSPVTFNVQLSHIDRVMVLSENSSLVANISLDASERLEALQVETSYIPIKASTEKFKLLGFSQDQQRVSTHRYMRYIPHPTSYLQVEKGLNMTFNPLAEYPFVAIYNKGSQPEHGWNVINNTLMIGDGFTYENDVDSGLSFFVQLPTLDQLQPEHGCVRPYSFWQQDHHEPAWEAVQHSLFTDETAPILNKILNEETTGAVVEVAREWLAAELNIASGANITEEIVRWVSLSRFSLISLMSNETSRQNYLLDSDIMLGEEKHTLGSLKDIFSQYNQGDSPVASTCVVGRPRIYIRAEYDTELNFDFLKLRIFTNERLPNSRMKQIFSVSGPDGVLDDWYYLDQFAGERVEIELKFHSDPAKTFGPIRLYDVVFSC